MGRIQKRSLRRPFSRSKCSVSSLAFFCGVSCRQKKGPILTIPRICLDIGGSSSLLHFWPCQVVLKDNEFHILSVRISVSPPSMAFVNRRRSVFKSYDADHADPHARGFLSRPLFPIRLSGIQGGPGRRGELLFLLLTFRPGCLILDASMC